MYSKVCADLLLAIFSSFKKVLICGGIAEKCKPLCKCLSANRARALALYMKSVRARISARELFRIGSGRFGKKEEDFISLAGF